MTLMSLGLHENMKTKEKEKEKDMLCHIGWRVLVRQAGGGLDNRHWASG